jgi:hypothetical protein
VKTGDALMDKLDLKKDLKILYKPSVKEVQIVDIPAFRYLMIDGCGNTENLEFQNAIQALYTVSYKAKFALKKAKGIDYCVMPLEGLWWADNMSDFVAGKKDSWQWTLLIMQPHYVTDALIKTAVNAAEEKVDSRVLQKLRFTDFKEGKAAQILYVGPFSQEHDTIVRLHSAIKDIGGIVDGKKQKHHEIYLSDFRKTAPEKLKTILRQPFIGQ